jgi:N-acyl-D-amino-acid deacylase
MMLIIEHRLVKRWGPVMHDLVIRNGKIVDGTGAPAFAGDISIDADKIVNVGGKAGAGRREIDATGSLVTPGWVDIHTHYDGQVSWDPISPLRVGTASRRW